MACMAAFSAATSASVDESSSSAVGCNAAAARCGLVVCKTHLSLVSFPQDKFFRVLLLSAGPEDCHIYAACVCATLEHHTQVSTLLSIATKQLL
jgi:hypothetical protein